MRFEAVLDMKELNKMTKAAKKYGQRVVDRANRDAVKRAGTVFSTEVTKKYNIGKEDFRKNMRIGYDRVDIASRLLTVGTDTHFSHTPAKYKSQKDIKVRKRNGGRKPTVTIEKGHKEVVAHCFILNPEKVRYGDGPAKEGGTTMLWKHEGEEVVPYRSLSAAQMASNEEVIKKVIEQTTAYQMERLEHYIEMELEKHADH